MAPHRLLRREQAPSASAARSPKVVIPSTIALLVIIAFFVWVFCRWYRQDDGQTLPQIERAIRRRRSSTVTSQLSAIDVEACRGVLSRAMRSTGKVIRSPSPIREEAEDEWEDVDLDSPGSRISPRRRSGIWRLDLGRQGRSSFNASKEEDGGDLVRVTTWGSIIAPVSWVRRFHSQKRRDEKEKACELRGSL